LCLERDTLALALSEENFQAKLRRPIRSEWGNKILTLKENALKARQGADNREP
jgi:hypothetical protein